VLAALAEEAGPGARETAAFIEATLAGAEHEMRARAAVERLALLAAAAALRGSAPEAIADMFARTRLAASRGMFGTSALAAGDAATILRRSLPS
jgi:putative acyl-CoA dehydrogenase